MPETKKVEKSRKEDKDLPETNLLQYSDESDKELFFLNTEVQKFFYSLHENYKNSGCESQDYSFIYWQMRKEGLIKDNLQKKLYESFIDGIFKKHIRIYTKIKSIVFKKKELQIEDELKDGEKPGDIRTVMNKETLVRLEKYNEIKSKYPKLKNIS